jgi:hypothetical protein
VARAHNRPEHASLEDSAKATELIFRGVVEKVEYATATVRSKDDEALPHTFVTYRVDEVIKGANPGKSLTLRFTGGRRKDAEFLVVANYPLFDAGDQDVLFVRGNGFRGCPLVGCAQGRFRLIDGKVYGEKGNEALLTEKGVLYPGPQRDLEPVRTHKVSQTVISRISVEDPAEEDVGAVRTYPGTHLTADAFVKRLREVVAKTHSKDELAQLRPVLSADPKKPFTVKRPPQVGPPKWTKPAAKSPTSAELAEEKSLEEGDDAAAAKTNTP